MGFEFDTSRTASGLLGVTEPGLSFDELSKYRVLMQRLPKDENVRYQYWLQPGATWLPVQYSGLWEFGICERIQGTSYRLVKRIKEAVRLSDPLIPFLQSTMYMNWTLESLCCKWLAQFRESNLNVSDLADIMQAHIKLNFKYDHELAEDVKLKYDYCPNLDEIWESGKGICFGLTAIFNAALRSYGIPAKMIHGWWGTDESAPYHCWSEVFLDGEWKLYDVTAAITVPAWFPKDMLAYKKRYEY